MPSEQILAHRAADHSLRVEAWGAHSVRVRVARGSIVDGIPGALLALSGDSVATVEHDGRTTTLVNGGLRVTMSADGELSFFRVSDGAELLAEQRGHVVWPGPRTFAANGDGYYRLEQRFRAYDGERLFGMGQHQHGKLDHKGMVVDLVQRNAEVSIPFVVSSRGYGFLWNLPAIGRAEFATNGTRWVADSARQIDYWVTTGDGPADILSHYADATGHTPHFPPWAAGLWQSKLRYESPDQLLEVAREYARRDLPLSVIVADYYHWPFLGDWRFDPKEWTDPAVFISELETLGVRLMVSVWPSLNPLSENFAAMQSAGLLVGSEQGVGGHQLFPDKGFSGHSLGVSFYDATNPVARDFVWDVVKRNYYDVGVRVWWLDGCEPEIYPEQFANLRFAAGPGREVANLYPREHARGFFEHMQAEGESEVISLVRSAWAGSQRYGAALWSGDIPTTFTALASQVRAGLSVAMSGLPWWTTDIGGFHGGDPDDDDYRELFVRWFQYATFCPLLRIHGHREPRGEFNAGHSGGPNELWSYGEAALAILTEYLRLRERLRPYILEQMAVASQAGLPPMRPLFVDFPDDPTAWVVDDEFLFGSDLLVSAVLAAGVRAQRVYLPAGVRWVDVATGEEHAGGQYVTAAAPLERIPVFARSGSEVLDCF
jgi:alpha-D-xyloside xylohydrolase